ncbi:MAG TPA: hypothetical protein VH021_11545 [Trebonia sp.]|nr:hypothetical protein [Trebonia sp.]
MPSRSANRLAVAGLLAAATSVSVSACASSSSSTSALAGLSPDQIIQKSVADLKTASSVRIAGNVVSSGQHIAINVTDAAAKGCQGTIGLAAPAASSSKAVSGTAGIMETGGVVYMKLSNSFFTSAGLPASDFSQVSGKYIKLTSGSNLASFAQLCNPSTLSGAFAKEDTGFVKAGTATVGGQPTLIFKQPKNPSNGTVYVSESAAPRILRIAGPAGQGSVDFSYFNATATIAAPPPSEVIDGSKFGL